MVELDEVDAFGGLALPVEAGACRLAALPAARRAVVTGPEPGAVRLATAQWLVEGPGTIDVSDAFAGLALDGSAAAEVLARLVPLDLDRRAFPPGSSARSLLRHLPLVLVARRGGFALLVPRSCAASAVEDIVAAMRAVAARREDGLGG